MIFKDSFLFNIIFKKIKVENIMYHKDVEKQGDLRDFFVLLTITRF